MIYIFDGEDKQAQADTVESPKHVWIDGERIVVYTGDDMPEAQQDAS
jgi:hypothetical protein